VHAYEPKDALVAGAKGSEVYERILERTARMLSKESSFILFETDPLVCSLACEAISRQYPHAKIERIKDYNGLERIVMARMDPCLSKK
jgi:methylase of polypeptide subunit release factors